MKKLFGLVLLMLIAGIAPCMAEHWVQWDVAEEGVVPYFYLLGDQYLVYTDKAGVKHRYQLEFDCSDVFKQRAGYAVLIYAGATDIIYKGDGKWSVRGGYVHQFFTANAGYVIADVDSGYAAHIYNGFFEVGKLVEVR